MIEVFKNVLCVRRISVVLMILDQTSNDGYFSGIFQWTKFNHLSIDLWWEVSMNIEYIGNSTRHTSCKVTSSRTQDDHTTSSHVFTAMVPHTFNNSGGARVSNSKSFSSNPTEETLAQC